MTRRPRTAPVRRDPAMLSGPDADAAHQAMMATLGRRLKPPSAQVNEVSRSEGGNDHPPGPYGTILLGDPQGVPSPVDLSIVATPEATSAGEDSVSHYAESSRPPGLQWLDPVVNPDKSGYVKDTTGAYTVLKELRLAGGWRYIAFFGSTVLGPSCVLLGDAKGYCLRHHREHP